MMWTRLREFFAANLGLKLLSLVVAVLLWGYVIGQGQLEVNLVVPLELRNLPPSLSVTGEVADYVDVRVSGRESRVKRLTPREVTVALDLSGAGPGRHVYLLGSEAVTLPPNVRVVSLRPQRVGLTLEAKRK
jgi:hypothetical protein